MNNILKNLLILILSLLALGKTYSNNDEIIKKFTLQEIIEIAKSQSFESILARHRFRSSYWEYKTYKAKYLPSLGFRSDLLNLNHSIENDYDLSTGTYNIYEDFINKSTAGLSLSQNIGFTGGNISINSNLERHDYFLNDTAKYTTNPIINIRYIQSLNGYNSFKWEREIEPLKYKEAVKEYIRAMEEVSSRSIDYFFNLALAQINVKIAEANYSNTDTLFKIATGRYNIGTISEDELLQMELSFLNADLALNEAKVEFEMNKTRLRSFLGYNDNIDFELEIVGNVPNIDIDPLEAYEIAKINNPDMIAYKRRRIEAERDVAEAKAEKGVNADLRLSFGLTQDAADLPGAYKDPLNQQMVSASISFPILDWGLGKGRYKMAQSAKELIFTSVEQSEIDFKNNLFDHIMRFNLQDDQLYIASKADTIANYRYYVSKQRFLIGNIDVLDLNVAFTEKDDAKRKYIQALKNYWQYYYDIRITTLYDFEKNINLEENVEQIY